MRPAQNWIVLTLKYIVSLPLAFLLLPVRHGKLIFQRDQRLYDFLSFADQPPLSYVRIETENDRTLFEGQLYAELLARTFPESLLPMKVKSFNAIEDKILYICVYQEDYLINKYEEEMKTLNDRLIANTDNVNEIRHLYEILTDKIFKK